MTTLDWPPTLLHALPLLALAACAIELALLVLRERRRGWGVRLLALPARLFQLVVLAYLAFGLGRPVSAAGALLLLAVATRAATDAMTILSRRGRGVE
jgi:hypothetical protein